MSQAAEAYAEFNTQTEETCLEYFLKNRHIYSENNFDDLSSTWTFEDDSVIKATEDNVIINAGMNSREL